MLKDLDKGKYTRWADGITEDQLRALLWIVGEHCIRTRQTMSETDLVGAAERRRVRAYNLLLKFHRRPFGLEEVQQSIREALKKHYVCHDCGKDVTEDREDDYEVLDVLWYGFGVGKGFLCLTCLEKRIGRRIGRPDLTNRAINYEHPAWKVR